MSTEEITNHLAKNDVKPSFQRLSIYQYLINKKNHPTADTIYKELVSNIPTLSKTTVYNTLKLFIDKGVAIAINIEDNEVRFDADTSTHGHFKCEKCNHIYDLTIDVSKLKFENLNVYLIKEAHFYFKGICEKCQKNNINNN